MENNETKFFELRIQNLISLRQLIVQVLVVLIGGIAGILFMPASLIKFTLLSLGLLLVPILLKNFFNIKNELVSYLYKNSKEVKNESGY